MKLRHTLLAALALAMGAFLIGCGDDEPEDATGDVRINFRLTYEGEPLVMGDRFMYPDGNQMVITRYSFFMLNGELSETAFNSFGNTIPDTYINLTDAHATAEAASAGFDLVLNDVPTGVYTSLSYDQGPDAATNAMSPSDFDAGSPLALTNEYWADWESYVFFKLEGGYDKDGDGDELEQRVVFHVGGDSAFRQIALDNLNVEVKNDEESVVNIEIKLEDLFTQDGELYDLQATPTLHKLEFQEQINFVASGAVNALTAN